MDTKTPDAITPDALELSPWLTEDPSILSEDANSVDNESDLPSQWGTPSSPLLYRSKKDKHRIK